MKFWDREREVSYLKHYLQSEPNAILFVYGPKSSGKSALMMEVLKDLSRRVYPYYYDLRLTPVSSYQDVISIFFRERGWKEKLKEAVPGIAGAFARYFEVEFSVLEEVLKVKLNPFEVMEGVLRGKVRKGNIPVIVFDEIQKLKGIYMNGGKQRAFIDELFNFFVALTKVRHLSHVIVMTSDTFFIEEVYSSSALKNTSEYYLVDYFDDDTAFEILVDEGLSEEDARYAVEWIGGVPWMMERVLSSGDVKGKVEDLYLQHRARLENVLSESYENGEYETVIETLKKVLDGEIDVIKDRKMVRKLVEKEVLFFDPINRGVKFQTRLDEKAAKELVG